MSPDPEIDTKVEVLSQRLEMAMELFEKAMKKALMDVEAAKEELRKK